MVNVAMLRYIVFLPFCKVCFVFYNNLIGVLHGKIVFRSPKDNLPLRIAAFLLRFRTNSRAFFPERVKFPM